MTAVATVEQLRVPQQEDDGLPVNRERLALLRNIAARRVRRNTNGLDVLASPNRTAGGYGSRVGGKARVLWAAGLAVLGADDFYELTAAGERRTVDVGAQYAAASVTAGR